VSRFSGLSWPRATLAGAFRRVPREHGKICALIVLEEIPHHGKFSRQ